LGEIEVGAVFDGVFQEKSLTCTVAAIYNNSLIRPLLTDTLQAFRLESFTLHLVAATYCAACWPLHSQTYAMVFVLAAKWTTELQSKRFAVDYSQLIAEPSAVVCPEHSSELRPVTNR
jgi:hypothetical protein